MIEDVILIEIIYFKVYLKWRKSLFLVELLESEIYFIVGFTYDNVQFTYEEVFHWNSGNECESW